MKKISILGIALLLIFAFSVQVFAEDISAGNSANRNGNGVGTRGIDLPDIDLDDDNDVNMNRTLDRTNGNMNQRGDIGNGLRGTGTNGNGFTTNNLRTNAAADDNNDWGWLGILGLLGLAGMFGRNRNPER